MTIESKTTIQNNSKNVTKFICQKVEKNELARLGSNKVIAMKGSLKSKRAIPKITSIFCSMTHSELGRSLVLQWKQRLERKVKKRHKYLRMRMNLVNSGLTVKQEQSIYLIQGDRMSELRISIVKRIQSFWIYYKQTRLMSEQNGS